VTREYTVIAVGSHVAGGWFLKISSFGELALSFELKLKTGKVRIEAWKVL
jgi:hypothetical protein